MAKDRMRLYRHSTMCGKAVQMFLNCNSHYWCCVPMKNADADQDDFIHVEIPSIVHRSHNNSHKTEPLNDQRLLNSSLRTDDEVQSFIDHLPIPPAGYRYSQRQQAEQYLFFKYKRDLLPPSPHLDLYNATIVFVCTYEKQKKKHSENQIEEFF